MRPPVPRPECCFVVQKSALRKANDPFGLSARISLPTYLRLHKCPDTVVAVWQDRVSTEGRTLDINVPRD